MTAKEKFYKRAEELGIEEFGYCEFGHYGIETENGIFVLVHEDKDDSFDEFRYPSMRKLSESDSLRNNMFDVFDSIEDFDDETIGMLYRWKIRGYDYDRAKYPIGAGYSSVYFACTPSESIRFEDDTNSKESLSMEKRKAMQTKFENMRDEWNKLNSKTISEIMAILREMPSLMMELDHVSLDVKGDYETFAEDFIKVELCDGDIVLTTNDKEEYGINDLSLGESLWLYYSMF